MALPAGARRPPPPLKTAFQVGPANPHVALRQSSPVYTTGFRDTVEAPDRATYTSAGQRVDRRISRTFCLVKRLSSPPARPWAVPAPLAGQSASPEDEGAWNEECRRYHHLAVQDLSGELAASPPARGRASPRCPVR